VKFSREDLQKQLNHLEDFGVINKDILEQKTLDPHKKKPTKKELKASQSRIYSERAADVDLDLHGYSVEESIALVEMTFEMMKAHQLRTLRIVHGGGRPGYGPVKKALDLEFKTRLKGLIRSNTVEPHNSGASFLLLK
jgi:DNA-nicking Smr family endonuclease